MTGSVSNETAVFVDGSIFRHVVVMASTSAVGLMTLFVVDLMDMFFLSLLGELELAAAVGYAGTILFFTTSIAIAIAITSGALVSRSLGGQDKSRASQYASNVICFGVLLSILISGFIWFTIPQLLDQLGAEGRSHELASEYLRIIVPSMVLLGIAMAATGILRAAGDARRAMYATVIGGVVNAVLDPILIFGLELGIRGAAIASVAARATVMLVALYGVVRVHQLLSRLSIVSFFRDLSGILHIAGPAMLTNVATPIGNAYVLATMAKFGDGAVAGMSIIGRVIPVAFGLIFALSGAVGPIIGQNFGAARIDRVRQTLWEGLRFSTFVVVGVSLLLFALQNPLVYAFSASDDAAKLIRFFCSWIAISFLFNGALFIANAAFNNLGFAHYASVFNLAKATLGTIPFVYLGALIGGAPGVLAGQAVGATLIGIAAIYTGFRVINRCDSPEGPKKGPGRKLFNPRIPQWPQSDMKG